jgi:hypothetical protein
MSLLRSKPKLWEKIYILNIYIQSSEHLYQPLLIEKC